MKKVVDVEEAFQADLDAVRRSLKYPDDSGLEYVDSTPVEVPLGFRRPLTLQEQIRQYLRQEIGLARLGIDSSESFEESLDFDDGEEPLTAAEQQFVQEDSLVRAAREAASARASAQQIRSLKARGARKAGGAALGAGQDGQEGAPPPAKPDKDSTPT